jgi:hypothetical protein
VGKLVRFFRRSRDRWKEKCQEAKRENKSLKTRLGKMKESRDRWKAEAREWRGGMWTEAAAIEEPAKNGERHPARRGPAGG